MDTANDAQWAGIDGVGSYTWWIEDDTLEWSAGLLALYGRTSPPENIAEFVELIHPEDRPRIHEELESVLASDRDYQSEFRILLPNGQERTVLDHGVVLRDTTGKPVAVKGLETGTTFAGRLGRPQSADNDAFRALEMRITRTDAVLKAVFDAAPVGLGVWDRDFRFVHINRKLAEMNGLPAEAHIGRTVQELLPDLDDPAGIHEIWTQILETGEPKSDIEVSGTTPANPGMTRHWREQFFPVRSPDGVIGVAAIAEDVTESKRANQQIDTLLGELNHRSKNMLTLISAIARQTARSHPDDFLKHFQDRLSAMAAAQDLLLTGSTGVVDMEELMRSQLRPVIEAAEARVSLAGDGQITIPASKAQTLALALHELATNAMKYGSLSEKDGELAVSWNLAPDGTVTVEWKERLGPIVAQPKTKGFGTKLIETMVPSLIDGNAVTNYDPEGLSWTLTFSADPTIQSHS